MVLLRNWPTLDLTRPLRPYLFGVAFRIVSAHRRRQARGIPHPHPRRARRGSHPEGLLENKQSIALLMAALERVPATAPGRRRDARSRRRSDRRCRAETVDFAVRCLRQASEGAQGAGRRRPAVARGDGKMKRRGDGLSSRELDELHGTRPDRPPLPDVVRARARARARAADAAAAAPTPGPAMTAPARGRSPNRLGGCACLGPGHGGCGRRNGVRRHDPAGPAPLSSAVTAPGSRLEAPEVAVLSSPATPEPKPPRSPDARHGP